MAPSLLEVGAAQCESWRYVLLHRLAPDAASIPPAWKAGDEGGHRKRPNREPRIVALCKGKPCRDKRALWVEAMMAGTSMPWLGSGIGRWVSAIAGWVAGRSTPPPEVLALISAHCQHGATAAGPHPHAANTGELIHTHPDAGLDPAWESPGRASDCMSLCALPPPTQLPSSRAWGACLWIL